MSRDDLPKSVFPKGKWFYLVVAEGPKRKWHKLSLIRDGLPALYSALAQKKLELSLPKGGMENMPALIGRWEQDVMPAHAEKTRRDERAYNKAIAAAFVEFPRVADIETPDCSDFLQQFKTKPRTFNAYRGQLRELFRYGEEKGLRPAGSNPIQSIRTLATPPRQRCPTTSELRRVKIAALYYEHTDQDYWKRKERVRTRSGMTMACLIEMAYLSGQDVSVMIRILEKRDPMRPDEPHVFEDGIFFRRDKTGNAVVITWSPRLRAVVKRLMAMKAERQLKKRAHQRVETDCLFTKQDGHPLTYGAVANAWRRSLKRANVLKFQFRDIRARALTDTDTYDGRKAANAKGAHATESQTADYLRHKTAREAPATR